jgi:general nucleoside transport system permease protein
VSNPATHRAPLRELLLALLLAAIVFDIVVLAWGETPSAIARQILVGTWGTAYGSGQVLFKATSILFAGVAARIALRSGLFNIGVDGSIAVSALAVGALGAALPATISPWIAWPLLACVAMIVGASWTLPAGILRARFGAHEVISGIMLNKIAASLVGWLLVRGLAEKASVHTRPLPAGAIVTRLEHFGFGVLRALHGSAANVALFVALVVAVVWGWTARRTVFGRELLAVAASPTAARASGTPVSKRFVQALAFSGAVAGLTALNDVMGYKGYAEEGLSAGVGFTGLAAALIGGESTLGLVVASLLFATLSQGGLAINARVPMEIVDVLSATLILLVSAGPGLRRALLDREPTPSTRKDAA